MPEPRAETRDVTLLELVDRLLDRGVTLTGDITISVADVDLIVLGLRLMLASAERMEHLPAAPPAPAALAPPAEPTEATHG
jgi:gas vesicle structural protein